MQSGEALSSGAAWLGAEVGLPRSSHALALWGICCLLLELQPGVLAALHPRLPISSGVWWGLTTHSQSSLPCWLPPLLAPLPCPLSSLVAAVCYPNE